MKIFLIAMGGMLVGLVIFVAVLWWWVKRKIRGFTDGLAEAMAGAGVPAFRITLEESRDAEWTDQAAVDAIAKALAEKGYQDAGSFVIPELGLFLLRGFCNLDARAFAALFEVPGQGTIVVDTVVRLEDDTLLTVSNLPDRGQERPPFAPIIRIEADLGAAPERTGELHDRLMQELGERTARPVSPADFKDGFIKEYHRDMDWRIERGGPTDDEIRNAAAAGNLDEPDAEAIALVRDSWSRAISAFFDEQIREQYLESSTMPAAEWEEKRDRLVFAHDRSFTADIVDQMAWWIADESDSQTPSGDEDSAYQKAKQELQAAFDAAPSVRQGFHEAVQLLPEKSRYEKIGDLDGPHPADIYLTPSEDDY